MTKKEKKIIIEVIDLLSGEECYFDRAISLLGGLVGIKYPAGELKVNKMDLRDFMDKEEK